MNLFLWSVSDDENEKFSFIFLFGECLGGNFDFCFLPFFVLAGKIESDDHFCFVLFI